MRSLLVTILIGAICCMGMAGGITLLSTVLASTTSPAANTTYVLEDPPACEWGYYAGWSWGKSDGRRGYPYDPTCAHRTDDYSKHYRGNEVYARCFQEGYAEGYAEGKHLRFLYNEDRPVGR